MSGITAITSRTGKIGDGDDSVELSLMNDESGPDEAFKPDDMEKLRELLYYREQHPEATRLELDVNEKR